MTTIVKYNPLAFSSPPFQDNFILDGATYTGTATWNFAAQRAYFTLTDSSGNIVWNGPLIGSPIGYDIPLALGVFQTSVIVYRETNSQFEVTP